MNTLTIQNLDDELQIQLRINAAMHKRSMEDEALQILRQALVAAPASIGLGSRISRHFSELDPAELELPARQDMPRAASFSK